MEPMCVPLKCASEIPKATWQNFFPAYKKDGTPVYVYKIISTSDGDPSSATGANEKKGKGSSKHRRHDREITKQYKMVDYGPLRRFFTGTEKKFPENKKPDNNEFVYTDVRKGVAKQLKFVYWTPLFVAEREKERINRISKKQQKSSPLIDINDEVDESSKQQQQKEEKKQERAPPAEKNLKRKRATGDKEETKRAKKTRVIEAGEVKVPVKVTNILSSGEKGGIGRDDTREKKTGVSSHSSSSSFSSDNSSESDDTGGESSSSGEDSLSSSSSSSSVSSSSKKKINHNEKKVTDQKRVKKGEKRLESLSSGSSSCSESDVEIDLSSSSDEDRSGKKSSSGKTNAKRTSKKESPSSSAKHSLLQWVTVLLAREEDLMNKFLKKGSNSFIFNADYLKKEYAESEIYALLDDITNGRVTDENDERFLVFQTFIIALHIADTAIKQSL